MADCVERFEFRGVVYEARLVKCGKKLCSRCPHGPYWYGIIPLFGQKPVTRYIGKTLKGPVAEYYNNHFPAEESNVTQR